MKANNCGKYVESLREVWESRDLRGWLEVFPTTTTIVSLSKLRFELISLFAYFGIFTLALRM